MNNPIIAIEGMSFSGKTTLINLLSNHDFELVPELATFNDNKKSFSPLPTNINDALESDDWFQKKEEKRCKLALEKQIDKKVIVDRWFISSTGYIFARDVLLSYNTLEYQFEGIKKRMNKGSLFLPYFVYLDVDTDTVKKRHLDPRKQYGGFELNGSLMVEPYKDDFFALQKYFYDLFAEIYSQRVLKLSSSNLNTV
ncbi:MAG: deoxynucleoside kinase [Nanoarchaeota archaeon]|nr:deoxynucleoside kinase [Nanoarchaeota archaeon]MBU1269459.1 deoxynucleoside kinase [Nanoarchaeota archaeon]MBU1603921.1 deoxynucleoside kinase [Nanoarchaeota archaeon]MBU2443483.1 deoxynucleoside kinase [Nanoarchaeota archaeon]